MATIITLYLRHVNCYTAIAPGGTCGLTCLFTFLPVMLIFAFSWFGINDVDDRYTSYKMLLIANSVIQSKTAQVSFINQSPEICKTFEILACQLQPPQSIYALDYDQIVSNMEKLFNRGTFVICKKYQFWSDGKGKPRESVQELPSRCHQGVVTCSLRVLPIH